MKEEHGTLHEAGAEVIAVSADSVESHQRFCEVLGGCPFPLASDQGLEVTRLYGVLDEGGTRSHRAIFVIDEAGLVLHKIPWYQPGNVGQFMAVFQALGVV